MDPQNWQRASRESRGLTPLLRLPSWCLLPAGFPWDSSDSRGRPGTHQGGLTPRVSIYGRCSGTGSSQSRPLHLAQISDFSHAVPPAQETDLLGIWRVVEHSEVGSLRHWGQLNGQGRHLATVISSKCLSLSPDKKLYLLLREEINAKVCHQLLHLGRGFFFLTSSRVLIYSWLNHEAYEQWCPSTCFVVPNAVQNRYHGLQVQMVLELLDIENCSGHCLDSQEPVI